VSRPTLLIVEDDDPIASGLTRVLESQGYSVRRARDGRAGILAAGSAVGLVILDLGLPDIDGIEVCRSIRATSAELPIIILSARDRELDIVAGLDAGADDYLVKPFKLAELLARIRAQMRRHDRRVESDAEIRVGDVLVDRAARRAQCGIRELELRPKEFDLLVVLCANAGRVMTRERLLAEVWDTAWTGSSKSLDMHILALRRQVGADAITTLRGIGYRFEAA
jgi:DNA-binding response OmpR family regulator